MPLSSLPDCNTTRVVQAMSCGGWRLLKTSESFDKSSCAWAATIPVPPPQRNEVRVRVVAAGVCHEDGRNDCDLLLPVNLGVEGSGIIECVGTSDGNSNVAPGDRVVVLRSPTSKHGGGAFSEFLNTDCFVKIPSAAPPGSSEGWRQVPMLEAAAIPVTCAAAYVALVEKLKVQSGYRIFIHGASGGVGCVAVQLAKHLGLDVIASCSSTHTSLVSRCGASTVLDYSTITEQDIVERVRCATLHYGVDCVLITSSSPCKVDMSSVLRFGGKICVVSSAVPRKSHDFTSLWSRQVSIEHVDILAMVRTPHGREEWRHAVECIINWYSTSVFDIPVEEVDRRQAPEALSVLLSGHTAGKLVLFNRELDASELEEYCMERKAVTNYLLEESI